MLLISLKKLLFPELATLAAQFLSSHKSDPKLNKILEYRNVSATAAISATATLIILIARMFNLSLFTMVLIFLNIIYAFSLMVNRS